MIEDEAAEVAAGIRDMGGEAEVFAGSVTEGGGQAGLLADIDLADWDSAFNLNTRAPLALAKHAYPHLKRSGGQIIIVASVSGTYPQPGVGPYSASKAAAIMLGRQLALEWGPRGIRTNMVLPGLIHTSLTDYRYRDPQERQRYQELVPVRQIGSPDDIAAAIAYLTGPDGAYCNGTELVIDGGFLQTFANQIPVVPRDQRR
jgi:glucose 1-dehydrogenase